MDIDQAIVVEDLTKSYGDRRILDGITFSVAAGEIFGLLGTNGAGKTTTVEILQGLRSRDGGTVGVLGWDPATDRHDLRRVIGSQLQSSALPERISVDEVLRLFTRLAGDQVDWRELRDEWGLSRLSGVAFGSMSGGQRQRLFLALALARRPRVVFLDELTQGLDPAARLDTWRLIEGIRQQGVTVVLVTHDMAEAARLCDRLAVIRGGRVVAQGTPADLVAGTGGPVRTSFSAPRDLVDSLNALPGVVDVTHDGSRAGVVGDAATPVLVAAELARRRLVPVDLTIHRPSLEDVFLALTGEEL